MGIWWRAHVEPSGGLIGISYRTHVEPGRRLIWDLVEDSWKCGRGLNVERSRGLR